MQRSSTISERIVSLKGRDHPKSERLHVQSQLEKPQQGKIKQMPCSRVPLLTWEDKIKRSPDLNQQRKWCSRNSRLRASFRNRASFRVSRGVWLISVLKVKVVLVDLIRDKDSSISASEGTEGWESMICRWSQLRCIHPTNKSLSKSRMTTHSIGFNLRTWWLRMPTLQSHSHMFRISAMKMRIDEHQANLTSKALTNKLRATCSSSLWSNWLQLNSSNSNSSSKFKKRATRISQLSRIVRWWAQASPNLLGQSMAITCSMLCLKNSRSSSRSILYTRQLKSGRRPKRRNEGHQALRSLSLRVLNRRTWFSTSMIWLTSQFHSGLLVLKQGLCQSITWTEPDWVLRIKFFWQVRTLCKFLRKTKKNRSSRESDINPKFRSSWQENQTTTAKGTSFQAVSMINDF